MATKLDLKFEVQKQPELTSIFLMCDAYYVEICCQDNGHVASVKLAQASTQVILVPTRNFKAQNFQKWLSGCNFIFV